MAFVFHCPQCASTLKTGTPIAEGRPIQCPHCNRVFTAADTTVREEEHGTFPQAPAAPPPPPETPPRSPVNEERLPPRRRDEDEGDRNARRHDRDEPPPRRRRDYEEDDRDRQRSRRRQDEDDYERRPRRRRYDEDDRPRRRPPPSGSNRTAVIVVLVIVGLLVAMVAIGWNLIDDEQDVTAQAFAPGVDTEMLAMAPADSVILAGIDVNDLRRNRNFAKLVGNMFANRMPDRQRFERKLDEAGISENDVLGVMVATSAPGGSGPVIAIRFNKDLDQKRVIKAFDGVRHTDEFKKYYTSAFERSAFFFAGKRLLVMADNRETVKKLLHHDRTQIQLPQELRDLAAKMLGQFWLVMKKDGGPEAMKGIGMGFGADDLFAGFADQTEALAVCLNARNDQLDCELGLKLKDGKDAGQVSQQLQAEIESARQLGVNNHPNFRNLPPDEKAVATAIVTTASFRNDGSIAYMKYRVSIGVFEKLIQMKQQGRLNRPRFGQ